MEQTTVTKQNQQEFYKSLYRQQLDNKQSLIDIVSYDHVVLVDCCGWHYEKIFQRPVTKIECLITAKNFDLNLTHFDKMIDDRDRDNLRWPAIDISDCVLIFDRSQLLRYRTIKEINKILNSAIQTYKPNKVIVRADTRFIDDNRFVNRINNLAGINIDGYVVEKFLYSVHDNIYCSEHRKYQ